MLERTIVGDPVPSALRKWNGQLEVFCFIDFSFVESEAAVTVSASNPIAGRKLYFVRNTLRSTLDKLRWLAGPLSGMFPIPAIGVDVLWFARKAKEVVHPKIPVDELAPYREDPLFYS